jgi:streptogramin lyase
MGRILVTGNTNPGNLYRIDPSQAAGAVETVASNLGSGPQGIAFDGARVWTANFGGSVSIVTPGATIPWTVTTVTTGFSNLRGAFYDGANVWVTDNAGTLLKLDPAGAILQTVTVGSTPRFPVFDGTNIWVPNFSSNSVSVVRASSGAVLQTLTGNGLNTPSAAAFDGQRVLVTNFGGNSVSLWKAADLTALGSFATGSGTLALGACSDGINFWIALEGPNKLARF